MKGKVYLVGAGPGDPELLTLKAIRVLGLADVVLHDDLVTGAILERVSPAASLFNVGKRCGHKSITQEEIHSLLVTYASAGLTVVRLHGGDPLVFGRAGEEIRALGEAGVDFEIIPGVTAATSAAAAAGVSLTERHVASSVVLTTGHRCAAGQEKTEDTRLMSTAKPEILPAGASPAKATFVFYMPSDYAALAAQLQAAGLDAHTPCLIVSSASNHNQETHFTNLAELPHSPSLPAPRVLIVGAVARNRANERLELKQRSMLKARSLEHVMG
jgi:uroporphyrin-III C-methyltransferase